MTSSLYHYSIVATLGPASRTAPAWAALLKAGAGAFRLNTSHLSLPETRTWLQNLSAFFDQSTTRVPVVLDLQGSKWRLGQLDPFELAPNQVVTLLHAAETSAAGVLPVPHADFFKAAAEGGKITLNDARQQLEVLSTSPNQINARVLRGGVILPRKGITLPGSDFRVESLSDKDRAVVTLADEFPDVRLAVSYVKDAAEMARYRQLLGGSTPLIAKLERRSALTEAVQIAALVSELWLCRGDLGAELGLVEMAVSSANFGDLLPRLPQPALLAGQVLEHLTYAPEPTRAEVCALYDALHKGYAGFVLSDETAVGQNPVAAVQAAALFQSAVVRE